MSHPINGSNNHKPRRPRPVTFTKNSTVRKNNQLKCSRLLISVNIPGSAGPLRFLVNEEELVANVISTALRSYAREGRLPVLGSDLNNFLLYCANAGSDALTPWEPIGSHGGRNFILCKKQQIGSGMSGQLVVLLAREAAVGSLGSTGVSVSLSLLTENLRYSLRGWYFSV